MFPSRKTRVPEAPPMWALAIENAALKLSEVPRPKIRPDEVLMKVAYAGINRADLLQVEGSYKAPEGSSPLPGLEVSGVIELVGEAVIGWSVGEEVCALLSGGGYAEYVAVPAAQVLAVPPRVTLAEAASLPEGLATAIMALKLEANLQRGERVLLHGGASGTGILIAQVARALGAEVYATVGSDEKGEKLKAFSIHPINHQTEDFATAIMEATGNEGVDVIIDILGGPALPTHLKLLRRNGRLVYLAMMQGNVAESVKLGGILMKHLRISGATLRSRTPAEKAEIVEAVRKTLWPLLSKGLIRPVVDSVFALEQAEKAHQRMQERLHLGKILLEVATERSA